MNDVVCTSTTATCCFGALRVHYFYIQSVQQQLQSEQRTAQTNIDLVFVMERFCCIVNNSDIAPQHEGTQEQYFTPYCLYVFRITDYLNTCVITQIHTSTWLHSDPKTFDIVR